MSFCTSSATLPTLTPALRVGGSVVFKTLSRGRDIDAEVVRLLDIERLFLGLHDVGQRGIARLVQAQVGGDDGGQLERTVSRPPSTSRVTSTGRRLRHDLGSERALRPAEQRRQHLARLIAVVVDGLLAEDDEIGLFRFDHAP